MGFIFKFERWEGILGVLFFILLDFVVICLSDLFWMYICLLILELLDFFVK